MRLIIQIHVIRNSLHSCVMFMCFEVKDTTTRMPIVSLLRLHAGQVGRIVNAVVYFSSWVYLNCSHAHSIVSEKCCEYMILVSTNYGFKPGTFDS